MKFINKVVVAAVSAAMVSGCASGGGGSGIGEDATSVSTNNGGTAAQAPVMARCAGLACLFGGSTDTDYSTQEMLEVLKRREPLEFTSWRNLELPPCDRLSCDSGYRAVTAKGPHVAVSLERASDGSALKPISPPDAAQEGMATLAYASYPRVEIDEFRSLSGTFEGTREDYSGLDVAKLPNSAVVSPFTGGRFSVALVANPFRSNWGYPSSGNTVPNFYRSNWDYQSFGVWNHQPSATQESIHAHSFGVATPGTAVPVSGTALFGGRLAGMYVSPSGAASVAVADVGVSVDFGSRSINFFSNNTRLTSAPLGAESTAAPLLDLRGTLTYAPGSATFSGLLVNNGGTMGGTSDGQFYGPTAQELGGVFALRGQASAETYVGGYGARR